jgi:hypothetical protein
MVRFSDWLAVESFVDSVDFATARKRAFVESMIDILGVINEALDDEEEAEGEDAVEKDDPFTGGEDAKPSHEVPSKSKEEHLRDMLEALKLIRKSAMAQRAQKVNKIRELRAAHSSDMDDEADLADALPDLVDLGYVKPAEAKKIKEGINLPESDPKNKKAWEALEEKVAAASMEQGNGSMSMMQDDEAKIESSKKELYNAIISVYEDKLERIVARNQRFAGDGIGHQHYEESEIADEMFMYILSLVSQRRWQGGELLPWGGGQAVVMDDGAKKKQRGQGIEEILKSSGDDKDLERMYAYFSSSVKSTATKIRRSAGSQLNPNSRGRVKSDIHTNKDKKAKQINDDIKSGELGFYKEYLRKAKESPLDQRSADEELVVPSNSEDKTRLGIMKAIEYEYVNRPSSRELLSMGEDAIQKTLENYVSGFLRRREKSVTHASTLIGDSDSSDDAVLSGVKAAFKKHDEPPEGSNPMDSADESQPTGVSKLIFDFFMPHIVQSINEISKEGLRPTTQNVFVFDKHPEMNGKTRVYVPGGIDDATMNSINLVIDNMLKREGDQAPERSRYKKFSPDTVNSYWVHGSIFNQFLQALKSKGKQVEWESESGPSGHATESSGVKGNRGAWEALALCIKFGIPCSLKTELRSGKMVPLDVTAQGESSIDQGTKEYITDIFAKKMRSGWDWDAFCREAFKNYGLNKGTGYQTIAQKWSQYPMGSSQKLEPKSLQSMGEYLEGTPDGKSVGGLIKLCNKMAQKIRF